LRFGFFFSLVCTASCCSARLLAQPLPSQALDAPLDDAALDAALREQAGRAHTHRYAWTAINGGLAVASFAVLPVLQRASRPDFIVSGAGSVLGAVATFVFPLRVESDEAELDAAERSSPEARTRQLHALLRADADDERDRLALPWHALNLGVSALAGGIIAFGFHHTLSGVGQGVGSFVLGEAQLFTQPTGLEDPRFSSTRSARLELLPQISIQSRRLNVGLMTSW
jgi:hypothetical protein